jgi:cyclic-di-AMP phosphodiesterase PgpH
MWMQIKRILISNRKKINVLLFLGTALILVLFFPHGGKFKYEYQKGKPWLHEVLIAPFDFPIYKSDADVKEQKDSVLKNYIPYFNFNPKTGIEQKTRFRTFFTNYWSFFERKFPSTIRSEYKYQYEQRILTLLDFIYNVGIIELPEDYSSFSKHSASIMQVRDNVAEESELSNVFSQKGAYEYLLHQLYIYNDQLPDSSISNPDAFFRGLKLEDFIAPNLYYDDETSLKMRDAALNDLSLTEGMVQSGIKIISTGEVVTPQAHKLLESLKKEYELRMGKSTNYIFILMGQGIVVLICILMIFIFITKFRRELLLSYRKLSFILFVILLFSFIASITIKFQPIGLYIVPFAIIAILLKTFYDTKLALFVYIITILLVGFWAPNSFEFVFLNISAGVVALLSLTNLYRRNKLFISSAWLIASYNALYLGIVLYQEGNLNSFKLNNVLFFGGNGLLILSSIPLIYIFEKMFGFLSDASLLELSDSNQRLLRKLAEIAPGTFQHSLQVANLSEEAIFKIGGNPLLVRAGSLYHDIGKIENPMYFVENLSGEMDPHENIDLDKSVEVIIGHVVKGIDLASKSGLPWQIIDFIRTHHGTSTVHYFYRSFLKMYPDSNADIEKFSYPGPKPTSREMAVVMMADSVEAASRSLKDHNENDINNLVEDIISSQLKEGQLNDANITLKEIEIVKNIFKKRLRNIYHMRIEYPKDVR